MPNVRKTPTIRYLYDALDRLIGHGGRDCERQRFYCDSHLATELGGSEPLSIFRHGDQLLAQHFNLSGQLANALLAIDQQCSTLAVLQANLKNNIAYLPYGYHPSNSGLITFSGFNGQRPEPLTEYYLLGNGYRAFNPTLMRFNSPDILSPFDRGGLNAYAYCNGDPINLDDPDGKSALGRFFTKIVFGKSGWPQKPVQKMGRYSEGIYLWVDDYHGKSRFNIKGHGRPGGIKSESNKILDAAELYRFARSNGFDVEKYENIRIVSCYSANRVNGGASLAQSFSNITGRTVKGFHEVLWTTRSEAFKLQVGQVAEGVKYVGVLKDKTVRSRMHLNIRGAKYRPEVFYPRESVWSQFT